MVLRKDMLKSIDRLTTNARDVKDIPKNPGNSFWFQKIMPFLDSLNVFDTKEIECSNKDEMHFIAYKFKEVKSKMLPKLFRVAERVIDNRFFIYIKREEDTKLWP